VKWCIWFSWAPERVERFLERMEAQGWRCFRGGFGAWRFLFEQAAPGCARYCVDYQDKVTPEYKQLLTDDGWELILVSTGWCVWRKPCGGQRPELYTDPDSLIQRNKRVIGAIGVVIMSQIPLMVSVNASHSSSPLKTGLLFLYLLMIGAAVYGVLRLWSRNQRLKTRKI
jgi:hypothetical protein